MGRKGGCRKTRRMEADGRWKAVASLWGRGGFYRRGEKFFTLCKCLIYGQVKATQNGCE